ncbi:Bax inhibitor-1/YccA family protein [uncultured Rhodospira sp.]|uniref:Bax inhibitor-1/YccA family protein n=1 Tax=uncultured Rhodospira sp. TaxID=1936189 RepID=UPI00260ED126|nr:Bax inhibitor-1/YccA family protein [uncultured Rhodospira sp.]
MALNTDRRYVSMGGSAADAAEVDAGLRSHMLRVYNLMASGLVLSGIVALLIDTVPAIQSLFYVTVDGQVAGMTLLGMIGMWSPLIILFGAMFMMRSASAAATQGLYWLFVTLQGIGLSILLQVYTDASVVRVFFITAAAFAALSLYGYTTKRSLSGMGSFLIMGVFGLVIAMIVNLFLQSTMLQFVISGIGVLVFSGLIAYDTQRIKEEYSASLDDQTLSKSATWAALSLYINFINLLQFLLFFLGNRE